LRRCLSRRIRSLCGAGDSRHYFLCRGRGGGRKRGSRWRAVEVGEKPPERDARCVTQVIPREVECGDGHSGIVLTPPGSDRLEAFAIRKAIATARTATVTRTTSATTPPTSTTAAVASIATIVRATMSIAAVVTVSTVVVYGPCEKRVTHHQRVLITETTRGQGEVG
jgi:hypothetical protein